MLATINSVDINHVLASAWTNKLLNSLCKTLSTLGRYLPKIIQVVKSKYNKSFALVDV